MEEDSTATMKKAIDSMKEVKGSKKTFSSVSRTLHDQYLIDGKTVKEWKAYFRVNIPKDANATICKAILAEVAEKYHEATFHYNDALIVDKTYTAAREKSYRVEYTKEIDAAGSKKPTAAAIQNKVGVNLQHYDDVTDNARLCLEFWKGVLEQLKYYMKVLTNITINIGYELKTAPHSEH